MADDPFVDPFVEQARSIIGASKAKAKAIRESAIQCSVCGGSMLPPRTKHYGCDPEWPLAGMRCTCAPGCSTQRWGDVGPCDPECEPCRTYQGNPLRSQKG